MSDNDHAKSPQTLEEGVAALATTLNDRDLDEAVKGKYGQEVGLLTIGEKERRQSRNI